MSGGGKGGSWRPLRASRGAFWGLVGILHGLWVSWGRLAALLAPSWGGLAAALATYPERLWGVFERSGSLGASLERLENDFRPKLKHSILDTILFLIFTRFERIFF